MKQVRIKWVKSSIGTPERHRRTIEALGLNRRGQSIVKEATPQVAGMIKSVEYLLEIEELAQK